MKRKWEVVSIWPKKWHNTTFLFPVTRNKTHILHKYHLHLLLVAADGNLDDVVMG